jgi:transcription antitermination factor NusG
MAKPAYDLGAQDDREEDRWFALRVKSRHEKKVAAIAHGKGFEEFLPLYQCRRRWSDRIKVMELPLFPGYLFCRVNPADRLPLLTIPGALHFVGVGKVPVPIGDAEIEAVQAAIKSGLPVAPWSFLEVGQSVRLEDGPLAGLEGRLLNLGKETRILVSVTLLRRSIAVEIERHWARPVSLMQREDPSRPASVSMASSCC